MERIGACGLAAWLLGFATLAFIPPSSIADEIDDVASCTEDAMLVLDASGSMVQQDKTGETRLQGAQEATRTVVPLAARYRRMGLVTLGPGRGDQCANVELKVPVQTDAAASIVDEVGRLPADGGTPLTQAVKAAADALHYRSNPAVVVVVSDGDETCGRDPCELARMLKATARDLTIHVIGLGADADSTTGASCLADITRGRKVTAQTAAELTTALQATLVCPQVSQLPPSLTGNTDKSKSR